MRHRYYKDVKVTDVTSQLKVVKLYPSQSLVFDFLKYAEYDIKVNLFSEYLIQENRGFRYTLAQKFDLTEWTKYGQTALGEVIVTVSKEGQKSCCCNFLIVLEGDKKSICVINPVSQIVKIRNNQVLEVVCFERSWKTDKNSWITATVPKSDKIKLLEAGTCELGDNVAAIPRYIAPLNPFLHGKLKKQVEEELDSLVEPIRQRHFFYSCFGDKEEHSSIYFYGKDKDASIETRSVNVVFADKSSKSQPEETTSKMYSSEEILKREKKMRDSLVNPFRIEMLDFSDAYSNIVVDIVDPKEIWDDVKKSRWEASLDVMCPAGVKVEVNADRSKYGRIFQSFSISVSRKDIYETTFLGVVNLVCEEKKHAKDGRRRLSCWYSPGREHSIVCQDTSCSSAPTPTSLNSKKKKNKEDDFDHKTLRKCDVSFEEIKFKSLCEGGFVTKFNEVKKKESAFGPTEPPKTGGERLTQEKIVRNNPFVVYASMADNETITLNGTQEVLLRIKPPVDELWCFNCFPHFDRLNIGKSKVIHVGQDIYQEVSLTAKNIPFLYGEYEAGCIIANSSSGTKKFTIKIDANGSFSNKKEVKLNIVSTKRIDSAGNTCISNWKHEDAVCVSPDKGFYLRTPESTSGYSKEKWRMEIETYGIPEGVVSKLTEPSKIDLNNPWFPCSLPMSYGQSYCFRPLVLVQPAAETLLRDCAENTTIRFLPLAKVSFINNDCVENSSVWHSVGEIKIKHEIKKSIFLCVDLNDYRDRNLINLCSEAQVQVKPEQKLKFKYSFRQATETAINSELMWHVGLYTPEMISHISSDKEDGFYVFTFKVVANPSRTGSINFHCDNDVRKIKLVLND